MTKLEPLDMAGAWHRLKREDHLEAFNSRRGELRATFIATLIENIEKGRESQRGCPRGLAAGPDRIPAAAR